MINFFIAIIKSTKSEKRCGIKASVPGKENYYGSLMSNGVQKKNTFNTKKQGMIMIAFMVTI